MNIEILKKTPHHCEYRLKKNDQTVEVISLETKTYLLHDICHFVVEKHLKYPNGFWGMLAQGFAFKELFGKENPQTGSLRFIEQIVGPVQSSFSGHLPREHFDEFIRHLNWEMSDDFLDDCLGEISKTMEQFQRLSIGDTLTLEWTVQEA